MDSLLSARTVGTSKRVLAVVLAVTTIVGLSGMFMRLPMKMNVAKAVTLVDGDVVRNPSAPGMGQFDVYILKHVGAKKFKRLVLNPQVFESYGHLRWENIKLVSQAEMDSYTTSELVRPDGDPKVYRLIPDGDTGTKQWLNMSAAEFGALYDWDSVYTVNSVDIGNYNAGEQIVGGGAQPVGSGLSVMLDSSSPAAGSVVADSDSADGAQALAEFARVKFSAGSDGAVSVKTLKLKRFGISVDTDLSNFYLYEGNNRLAEMLSVSAGVITFQDPNGLFSVPAGQSRVISLRADIANGTDSGKTIGLGINAASDVMTDGAAVSGSFPVNGALMSTAKVSDLGSLEVATLAPSTDTTVDPGVMGFEVWKIKLTAGDQKVDLHRLNFTLIGSVAASDLRNLELWDGGTKLGSTMQLSSDKTLLFDLSASPLRLDAGQVKNLSLKADVVGGTNRDFKFSLQKQSDVVARDINYGVYLKPNKNDSFSVVQSAGKFTVSTGKLTVSVNPASPSGNVAQDMLNQEVARFDFLAAGENVKVTDLSLRADVSAGASSGLDNARLYLDGVQVGLTKDLTDDDANGTGDDVNFTFGNSFIVPAGMTKTLVVRADIKSSTAAQIAAGRTLQVFLLQGSSNANGVVSLEPISTSAASGRLLTVRSGALSAAKNASLADYSASQPLGVKSAAGVKIGSFVLTAGAGEGVRMSQIVLKDGDKIMGRNFQNMLLKNSSGMQLGSTQGTLSSASSTYTYNLSPNVEVMAGSQYVVDVYADILSGAQDDSVAFVGVTLDSVAATGLVTNADASYGDAVDQAGQNVYIAANGSLASVSVSADTPVAQQVVMGTSNLMLGRFRVEADPAEAIDFNKIAVTAELSSADGLGNFSNLKLYDGDTLLGSVASLSTLNATTALHPYAEFNLASPWRVPAGQAKVLTVKGDVSPYPNASSSVTATLQLRENYLSSASKALQGTGVASGVAITGPLSPVEANALTSVRTKLSVALDPQSPVGGQGAPSSEETVAIFALTNSSNVGNYEAKLSDLAINISKTGTWSAASSSVKVYVDSVATANLLGQSAVHDTEPQSVAFAGWTAAGGDSNPAANSLKDVTVAAGQTRKIFVTVTTSGAPANGTLTASIPSTNGMKWEDGVRTGASAFTTVDSLPVNGNTRRY